MAVVITLIDSYFVGIWPLGDWMLTVKNHASYI